MTEQEQRLRLNSGRLPTVEEFWGYRLGASAVFIMLAVNEYVIYTSGRSQNSCRPTRYAYGDLQLPPEIFNDRDMRCIWEQTNIIVAS
jgi:hypothetical protein